MKKSLLIVFLFLAQYSIAQTVDFNKGWKFFLGDDSNASRINYNDAQWRSLNVPHDWSIEGEFSASHPATTQGGALPGGIGWYRKTFFVPDSNAKKPVVIEFDGVYRNSEVWINGEYLGKRPNGYISFNYTLTDHLNYGKQKNVIAVKVDNSQQPNSRWYSGSGIYRNVKLITKGKIGVALESVDIYPTSFSYSPNAQTPEEATLHIQYYIYSTLEDEVTQKIKLRYRIIDPKGKLVSDKIYDEGLLLSRHLGKKYNTFHLIKNPHLWSPDSPALYKVIINVIKDGKVIDEYSSRFGLKESEFKEKGYFLNRKPLKIKGVCMHHDLGALGAAFNIRALERQLEILKAMGCNAIRTAHNPPAPELLDLCDRMGFLVMVEAFDMWAKKKNKYDYFSDFKEWHERDLVSMVNRDRNHVSVFMWSIGNEIREQFDSTGITLTKKLVNITKGNDFQHIYITAGLSEWNPSKNFMYKAGALPVLGFNYHHEKYDSLPYYYPGQLMLASESVSGLATRGHYDFPSDSIRIWPEHSPLKYVEKGNPDYTVSAYDNVYAYWGSTHEQTWKIIKKHDYMAGLFVWTGFDYLGEPTPYPWPARSSYFGIVDLAGFPKDVYYMYQSEWTTKPVLHIFPHWNWSPGKIIDIWAYYNNADEVELFLNDKSLGIRKKQDDDLHVMWRVPFKPGVLKAISRKNGKTVLTKTLATAGAPARLELVADRSVIKADGKDLSFVTVRILDKNGNLVPDADHSIQFSVEGAGKLAATDNGFQADTVSFKSPVRKCWKGMALAIVQSAEKKGNITLRARATGLPSAVLTLKAGE